MSTVKDSPPVDFEEDFEDVLFDGGGPGSGLTSGISTEPQQSLPVNTNPNYALPKDTTQSTSLEKVQHEDARL